MQRPNSLRDWLLWPLRAVGWLLQHLLLGLVRFYQLFISPLKPPSCRFYPTCSSYAIEALKVHGPLKGSWLAIKRIGKCHPLHPGGVDLVPPAKGSVKEKQGCHCHDADSSH